MRKVFLFFAALFAFNLTFAFSGFKAPSNKASQIFIPVGADKQISLLDLSSISVTDFQLLTGKHLSFFERVSFKLSQRKLRHSINADGSVNNKKLLKLATAAADGGGFNIGGFALGFLLGLIGVLIAYLIHSDNKAALRKWAWIGLGVEVVLSLLIFAL